MSGVVIIEAGALRIQVEALKRDAAVLRERVKSGERARATIDRIRAIMQDRDTPTRAALTLIRVELAAYATGRAEP